jgi:hypothetical protein
MESVSIQSLSLRLLALGVSLALAASASAADPARAPPPACVVSAGARSFDLAELGGGGGDGESVVPALRHVSHAAESRGWTYSFAACGVVAPLPAACAGAAPGSAALQQTISECFGLGASATRAVAATATGVELSFGGGDGGRSSVITIECADVARPQVVRWGSGAAPGSYTALVRARAGCALECGRDSATGAVCGGKGRGACISDFADGASRCVCSKGYAGPICLYLDKLLAVDSSTGDATFFIALGAASILSLFAFSLRQLGESSGRRGATAAGPRRHEMGATTQPASDRTREASAALGGAAAVAALLALALLSGGGDRGGCASVAVLRRAGGEGPALAAPAPVPVFGLREELGGLLELEAPGGSGVELGVQRGVFARATLSGWPSCAHYVLVDLWAPLENYVDQANVGQAEQNAIMAEALAATAPWAGAVEVCRNFTTRCAPRFADESFDFVYVDARHDRLGVSEDLEAWWPKARRGGLVCGHDFVTQSEGPAQSGQRW